MKDKKVTVIMPALNEEKNLCQAAEDVFSAWAALGIQGELIIVNDGSSDGTSEVAETLMSQRPDVTRVIHHGSPQGIGASFWAGVKDATGWCVVMVPADGENDAAEILKYLPLTEQVDIVVPFVSNPCVRPVSRRLLSSLYRLIVNLTFGISVGYTNGTVMYRREILKDVSLRAGGFFYQAELLVKTIRKGCTYKEVPCRVGKRISGPSKALTMRSLAGIVRAYLRTVAEVRFARQ